MNKILKFNDNLTNIIEDDSLFYWKTIDDIPYKVKLFINNISSKIGIYDEHNNKYYCSKCLNQLDERFHCNNCFIEYENDNETLKNIFIKIPFFNREKVNKEIGFYIFDVINDEVLLYLLKEKITICDFKDKVKIHKVFNIKKDRIIELTTKSHYLFKNIDDQIINSYNKNRLNSIFTYEKLLKYYNDIRKESSNISDDWNLHTEKVFIYTNNLTALNNTIYRYTNIWKTASFLNNKQPTILELTYMPIFCPQFEYLINYGLYNLAFTYSRFLIGKNFQEIFGIEKEYLSFMKDININIIELAGLRISFIKDKKIIYSIGKAYTSFIKIKNILPNFNTNLFLRNILNNTYNYEKTINNYCDYLNLLKINNFDFKSKRIVYPNNFYETYFLLKNPEIDNKIKSLSNILSFNKYEDEKYVIIPASSLHEMIEEANYQHNCLVDYCEDYSNNKTHIYFMREKEKRNTPFITIEINNNKVAQAYARYNKRPEKEIIDIIKKWSDELNLSLIIE